MLYIKNVLYIRIYMHACICVYMYIYNFCIYIYIYIYIYSNILINATVILKDKMLNQKFTSLFKIYEQNNIHLIK